MCSEFSLSEHLQVFAKGKALFFDSSHKSYGSVVSIDSSPASHHIADNTCRSNLHLMNAIYIEHRCTSHWLTGT